MYRGEYKPTFEFWRLPKNSADHIAVYAQRVDPMDEWLKAMADDWKLNDYERNLEAYKRAVAEEDRL